MRHVLWRAARRRRRGAAEAVLVASTAATARRPPGGVLGMLVLLALVGCRQDMHDQPKYQPFERNAFFADQRASRPLVPGVVARGHLDEDQAFFTGASAGAPVQANPLPLTREVLLRGQERFNIYCSPCHDRVGNGEGMIVQRGYKQPPSLHSDRLRGVPDGYLFQVMSNGFGVMPTYAPQVSPRDRWAIIAYIRALQYSQHAALADVPESERAGLGGTP
jgi:mono/diheme cytochrome c family protein